MLTLSGLTATAQTTPKADVWYPVYPVLQGKIHNPVARINLPASADGQNLEEIVVRLEEGNKGLENVQIFSTGRDSVFSANRLLATATAGESIRLKNDLSLRKGDNYLWVSLQRS